MIPQNPDAVYSDEFYVDEMTETSFKNHSYRKQRFGQERLQLIHRFLGKKNTPTLLDVGCGTGWFLESAQESGFKVFGQEFGKSIAAWTSNRLNIPVWTCLLRDIPEKFKFDVITMFDVLEHVPDPKALIREAKRLLRTNGFIMVFTPNLDSVGIQLMKESSSLIVPSEHLLYFTKSAVERLAKETGLALRYFCTAGIDLGDLASYYTYKNDREMARACEKLYPALQPVIDAAEAANHMRFIFSDA